MKQPILTANLFTPAEAERITGLSTVMQRDWRHRGFIKKDDGHARFDCFGLAQLMAQKMLSDRGVGPQASNDVAEWIATGIVVRALGWVDAYDGEDKAFPPSLREKTTWGQRSAILKRKFISESRGVRVEPAPIFIWWPDGEHTFHYSFDEAVKPLSGFDPKLSGPIIVLDLDALGSLLLERAGRPLVLVEAQDA